MLNFRAVVVIVHQEAMENWHQCCCSRPANGGGKKNLAFLGRQPVGFRITKNQRFFTRCNNLKLNDMLIEFSDQSFHHFLG